MFFKHFYLLRSHKKKPIKLQAFNGFSRSRFKTVPEGSKQFHNPPSKTTVRFTSTTFLSSSNFCLSLLSVAAKKILTTTSLWEERFIWLQVIVHHLGKLAEFKAQTMKECCLLDCLLWFAQLPFSQSSSPSA